MKSLHRWIVAVASAAFFIACTPAVAQWQTPDHSVPIGRGAGTGFKSAAPASAGTALISNGPSADPSFQPIPGSSAAANYYIAPSPTGNDSNNCLSVGTPCLTFQHVANLIAAFPFSSSVSTINVAAGTYSAGVRFTQGNINIVGAGSATTTISDSATPSLSAAIRAEYPAQVGISGMQIVGTVSFGIWALYSGVININSDVWFFGAPAGAIACQDQGQIYGNADFQVSGVNGSLFHLANCSQRYFGAPPRVTFTGSPTITNLLVAINGSSFKSGAMQFIGGGSVTSRYQMALNSIVDQEQNATDWPGAIQGTVSGGAVYYNVGSTFTGQISGTTLTVTGMVGGSGALGVNNQITGAGVPANTKITAFGTGTGLNGTYTVNNSATVGPVTMTSKSIYPCIDSVGLCPVVVAAPTGLGTGGTATVSNDGFGGDYGGVVTLNTGTSPGSSGSLWVLPHSAITECTATPNAVGTAVLPSAAAAIGATANVRWIQIFWSNGGVALSNSSTYNINYSCR